MCGCRRQPEEPACTGAETNANSWPVCWLRVRPAGARYSFSAANRGSAKTALLDYLGQRAVACRVLRAGGAEAEMELAFAGLHQLCAPLLDRLDRLSAPQQDALATAFGLRRGQPA